MRSPIHIYNILSLAIYRVYALNIIIIVHIFRIMIFIMIIVIFVYNNPNPCNPLLMGELQKNHDYLQTAGGRGYHKKYKIIPNPG